jgi:uncharacterized protein YjdB
VVTVSSANVPVTSVTINKLSTTLAIDGTETLTATVAPSNATNQTLAWASSDTAVATVNATTGVVTGVTAGTTNITATADGVTSAACVVTVSSANVPVTSVRSDERRAG